jgi:hypothetical protein
LQKRPPQAPPQKLLIWLAVRSAPKDSRNARSQHPSWLASQEYHKNPLLSPFRKGGKKGANSRAPLPNVYRYRTGRAIGLSSIRNDKVLQGRLASRPLCFHSIVLISLWATRQSRRTNRSCRLRDGRNERELSAIYPFSERSSATPPGPRQP